MLKMLRNSKLDSLKEARVLLSNDDGAYAAGIHILEQILERIFDDIWVAAPTYEQSGAGHSLTIHRPLRIKQLNEKRFAIDGTPTDCVLLAVCEVLKDKRPDLIISGINYGRNVADHITYSGTVAAAMEATLLGIPSIAISLEVSQSHKPRWENVETYLPQLIQKLPHLSWPPDVFLNVNFPDKPLDDIKGFKITQQGRRHLSNPPIKRDDPFGIPYYWLDVLQREPFAHHTDLDALIEGWITVTPLHVNLTHYPTIDRLTHLFNTF